MTLSSLVLPHRLQAVPPWAEWSAISLQRAAETKGSGVGALCHGLARAVFFGPCDTVPV